MRSIALLTLILLSACASLSSRKDSDKECSEEVCVVRVPRDHGSLFTVSNPFDYPITFSLRLEHNKDVESVDVSGPQITKQLKPHEAKDLFTLKEHENPTASALRFQYHFWWNWGRMSAVPDTRYIYRVPFLKDVQVITGQSSEGSFTHFDEENYAIDFLAPIGTIVCAARDGVVIRIKQDSNKGGDDASLSQMANYVYILHSDGTVGHYLHFKKNTVKVKLDQHIRRGEPIAEVGNTGYTTEAHLHFDVSKPYDGRILDSIPLQFKIGNAAHLPTYGEKVSSTETN